MRTYTDEQILNGPDIRLRREDYHAAVREQNQKQVTRRKSFVEWWNELVQMFETDVIDAEQKEGE